MRLNILHLQRGRCSKALSYHLRRVSPLCKSFGVYDAHNDLEKSRKKRKSDEWFMTPTPTPVTEDEEPTRSPSLSDVPSNADRGQSAVFAMGSQSSTLAATG